VKPSADKLLNQLAYNVKKM